MPEHPPSAPSAVARPVGRVAALDGLRGLALLGMLAWHAQVGWVKGGFARMTIFFVLSGYLATASWLSLRRRQDPRPFATFWRRRVRRLVPITLLGVALGVAVTAATGGDAARRALTGDAASVLGGLSNWRFLFSGQSYGELFERPSAFQHFWSLSLEEQCFWLLPLVLAGAGRFAGRRAWLAVAAAGTALCAIPAVVAHSPDAAYYGTHVRGGEFLVGAVLAMALAPHGGQIPPRWRRPVNVLGSLSLAALVLVMLTVDRTLSWLYEGGLGLFALPAVAVVAACRLDRGPTAAVLRVPPLPALGRAAFSIYALHWPLFQLLSPQRTGLAPGPAIAAQLAVGIGVGLVVHRVVERPLLEVGEGAGGTRRARLLRTVWTPDRRALPALGAAAVAVLAVAVAVPDPPAPYDLRRLEAELAAGTTVDLAEAQRVLEVAPVAVTAPAARLAEPEVRYGFFGGSSAVALGATGERFSARSERLELAPGYARLGCGLVTEGLRTHGSSSTGAPELAPPDDYCLGWDIRWPAAATLQDLDLAVVMAGVWEIADWRIGDPPTTTHLGDPGFDLLLALRLHDAVRAFEHRGIAVVLVTTPEVGDGRLGDVHERRHLGADHADRVARYNEILRLVAADHPDVTVIEYGSYVDRWTDAQRNDRLPDGIHATEAAGERIWDEFFGAELEGAVDELLGRAEPTPLPR